MEWIQKKLGGHLVVHSRPPYKTVWKWVASGRERVEHILMGCVEYMIVKAPQARLVLDAMNTMAARQSSNNAEAYVWAINKLNKKGGPQ